MPAKVTNKQDVPRRADMLLSGAYPQYSRAALAKLFVQDQVINKSGPIKAGFKLRPGDSFSVDLFNLQKPAESIEMPIIFENKDVVVVNKPVGVISHARGRYWDEASVASFVRSRVTGIEGERAGIVHRLDRATSGVMVCAKNSETLSLLQRQFAQRKTKKTYFAVVNGLVNPAEAIIDVPLGRNPKKPQTFRPDSSGKSANTAYKVIKTNNVYSLIQMQPQTGRTHQLRVHLKYINHPIVGDTLYGGAEASRLFLHAYSIEITIPGGERKTFISELPAEFNDLLK